LYFKGIFYRVYRPILSNLKPENIFKGTPKIIESEDK